ncbi:DMT family transporter [Cellulomonas cellasea]|uniref:Putative blue pigment (Indigoidine) exporter n=1 Tax=Cellulomonas cellasea TaxID=43670 RepID=A0A7W4YBG8_9CELL|nr:DMT family transporter [Cellulomonas cellasea]MBB2923890.1 putative blue pigment (indigoidine) exporter [Cellulomonas cellasea]
MEDRWRWVGITAVAPVLWGASYVVTRQLLPPDSPLWGSVLRALPAGLVLLAVARRLPSGSWWWRSLVLGTLTIGAFFVLVYVAAQLLPSSLAATLMSASPAVMMLLAWPLLAQRPRWLSVAGVALGVVGVAALLLTGAAAPDPRGVAASVLAMLMSSLGFVLSTRWSAGVPALPLTAWQLLGGAVVLVPVAVAVEGAPPALDGTEIAAFAFLSLVATAVAYLCWFAGLARLDAGTVGLVGLLNPVTGAVLGVVVAAEGLTVPQVGGMLLVLGGIALGASRRSARSTSAPAPEPGGPPRSTRLPSFPVGARWQGDPHEHPTGPHDRPAPVPARGA